MRFFCAFFLTAAEPQRGKSSHVEIGLPVKDPFAQIGKIEVAVDISSVLRASVGSFRVAWVERRYENASLAATERWTAILTIVVEPPRDAERLRKNPLGVFVDAVNWSKEFG